MFLSLQRDLRNELCSPISNLHSRIDHVEECTDYLERLMSEHSTGYNKIADTHDHHAEEFRFLQTTVADLEYQSRRNNIKAYQKPLYLIPYIQQPFLKLLPQLHQADLIIDHAHRIDKPNHLPASVPRDVLAFIHFFQVIERIMAATRSASSLPDPYSKLFST